MIEEGDGETLVVMAHGVLDRARSFAEVMAELRDECTMIAWDRRGYGRSRGGGAEPVGVEGHIHDMLGLIDGRPCIAVGHSFGGVTALGTALRAPDLVRAVVLYETGMAWLPVWNDDHMRRMLWGEDPELTGVRMILGERFEAMDDELQARWVDEGRAFIAEERSVRSAGPPYDVTQLRVPLVFGRSSADIFGSVGDHLGEVVPQLELVEIPGAGHMAHKTRPDAFADLIRRGIELADRADRALPPGSGR